VAIGACEERVKVMSVRREGKVINVLELKF
jgi:hypothetical protein